jgi:hypothetical protein
MKRLLISSTRLVPFVLCAAMLAVTPAALQANHVTGFGHPAFGIRPIYSGIPNNAAGNVVVYSLPSTDVNSFFDVSVRLDSGDFTFILSSGFGAIMEVGGNGEVTFNPPLIPDTDPNDPIGPPNNIAYAFTSPSQEMEIMYGVTNLPGRAGDQVLGLIAMAEQPGINKPLVHGDGLAAIPIKVAAGTAFSGATQQTFSLGYDPDVRFTGFVNTDAVDGSQAINLSNPAAFPHQSKSVVVRKSILGDMNGDLAINVFDISGFVAALSNLGAYQSANPWLHVSYIADINGDAAINVFDIAPFVAVLSAASPAASPAAVPEPGTAVLGAIGMALFAAVGARRRWARKAQ